MAKKSSGRAAGKLKDPTALAKAVKRISVDLKNDQVAGARLLGGPLQDSFKDSFNDGPVFRDTFVDGGQFLSNFNNLSPTVSVQHPAVLVALQKLQQAAAGRKSGG